jgi:hypothetical protein
MMFDPTSLGQALQPGDKMTLSFHKGQPKTAGGSFMDNATKAGAVPSPMGAAPQAMPAAPPPMAAPMGAPMGGDDRGALLAALQAHMGGGQ